jgi:cytosine/adenosine deaminase-related metal-dependent hydrolase
MNTLQARYVLPVAGEPIRDGTITLDGEQIAAVGRKCGGPVHDLGNVAIVPGFVNAHAHLDFSELAKPLGRPGIDFVDWIRLVMQFRRQAAGRKGRAVELGLQESARCGTTMLGDIAQPNWPTETVAAAPLAVTVFQEFIGPTRERIAPALALAQNHCHLAAAQSQWQAGLSPHAPYSVHVELLAALVALSNEQRVPIAMHLAESSEELQLLRSGDGPLRALLQGLGAWDTTTPHPKRRVLDDLRVLAAAHRALVVHGGCLDDHELRFLAEDAGRMAVVYCPRTHAWFQRAHYPLEKMLAAGVTVALGTDGRGSSPDLSVLGEMRCVAEQHPSIALPRVLQMGTIDGARALGQEREAGSLEPGKRADLAIIALPNRDAADAHELLFDSAARVIRCYCRGREVYRSGNIANS